MTQASDEAPRTRPLFERVCLRMGSASRRSARARGGRVRGSRPREDELASCLATADLRLSPGTVLAAANTVAVATLVPLACAAGVSFALSSAKWSSVLAVLAVLVPVLARESVIAYPKTLASRSMAEVLRGSTEGMNLMIMSLRHEPSIPGAIALAADRDTRFAKEMRRAMWSVVVGVHSSFEDALCALGDRMSEHGSELKSALHAIITASFEATQEGRRRALDRANGALVAGAKRRIEDYAAALSLPAMILFSIGVLLPLMVGSFLPMLSWSTWSGDGLTAAEGFEEPDGTLMQAVFLMNLLFPGIAVMVVLDTRSRHPLPRESPGARTRPTRRVAAIAAAAALASLAGIVAGSMWLEGLDRAVAHVLSATVPASLLLVCVNRHERAACASCEGELGDLLFRTGARMVEGENLESALTGAAAGASDDAALVAATAADAVGLGADGGRPPGLPGTASPSMAEGFRVLRDASSKDEEAAGLLAMDLARYLKDMAELETALRRRLKPTISMMRLTTVVLAPLMMGVTYAIYVSLASIGGTGSLSPDAFFIVLGAFLAETNAVVSYFVWVTDRSAPIGALAFSLGSCMLVSELVYSATAMIAS